MSTAGEPLSMYGTPVDHEALPWTWVEDQLAGSGTYWVCRGGTEDPHPRPVWGVWVDDALQLTLGSPRLRRAAAAGGPMSVHLPSGTDVVVVDGRGSVERSPAAVERFLAAYRAKYDWTYDVDRYGPPTRVEPVRVLAWRAVGEAGRDGFRTSGRWTFP